MPSATPHAVQRRSTECASSRAVASMPGAHAWAAHAWAAEMVPEREECAYTYIDQTRGKMVELDFMYAEDVRETGNTDCRRAGCRGNDQPPNPN